MEAYRCVRLPYLSLAAWSIFCVGCAEEAQEAQEERDQALTPCIRLRVLIAHRGLPDGKLRHHSTQLPSHDLLHVSTLFARRPDCRV